MNLIKTIAAQTEYTEDGSLVWVFLPRRKERIGRIAGSLNSTDGYIYIKSLGRRVGAHRVVFYKHHGWVPEAIDHINRVRSDNRIENLRDAKTNSNNGANQTIRMDGSSEFKGVCWDKNRSKWIASIKIDGRTRFLGRFKLEADAAKSYDVAAVEAFGCFANPNYRKP